MNKTLFTIRRKLQVDNFVFALMADASMVISTVDGETLGIYMTGEDLTVTVTNMFEMAEKDEKMIPLLRNLAISLLLAKHYVIVDSNAIEHLSIIYQRLQKRIVKANAKFDDEAKEKDEDIMDEVEERERLMAESKDISKV